MAGKLHLVKRQSTLLTPRAQSACAGERAAVVFGVVRGVEFIIGRRGLEALHAVPSHVLQHEQGAVGGEEVVEVADADDGVVGAFDDVLQDSVLGGAERVVRDALVVGGAAEDVGGRALVPVGTDGGVDGFLDVGAVEVDSGAGGKVVTVVDDAELGPEVRAGVEDVVDVEAGVYF